jgi:predicted P-loop ATPase
MEENFTGVEKMLRAFMGSSMIPDWDPFVDYFENLPEWDGIDHIQQLANFVETDDKIWWDLMFRKALVRQVACATGVVHYNKQCVVLCGVTNNGKSKFLRFLIPKRLSKYITENPDFSQSGNKDAKLSVAKNFQIILEELGNFLEKELKAIKSQMSSEYVNERLLYDRNNTFMYRKATFWGNTDQEDFLTDPQGNVRFVVIQVKNINHDEGGKKGYNQNVNMDNVWAQAYHLLKNGYIYHLTKAEIEKSEANNTTEYMKVSKEEELIVKYFKPANKRTDGAVFKTTTDITIYLEQISRNISNWKVGVALKKLKFERISVASGNKGYFVIENIK